MIFLVADEMCLLMKPDAPATSCHR